MKRKLALTDEYVFYWKWKSQTIDFAQINDIEMKETNVRYSVSECFAYLGIPDNEVHEWANGIYSTEYNGCLKRAINLGLVEPVWESSYGSYDEEESSEERLINIVRSLVTDGTIPLEKISKLLGENGLTFKYLNIDEEKLSSLSENAKLFK